MRSFHGATVVGVVFKFSGVIVLRAILFPVTERSARFELEMLPAAIFVESIAPFAIFGRVTAKSEIRSVLTALTAIFGLG